MKETKEQLIQMLANAQTTYATCGGHHKAEMNRQRVVSYKKQLTDLGIDIPINKKLYEIGIFNGEGAY